MEIKEENSNMNLKLVFGQRIKELREKENLTQESFGKRVNLSGAIISNYEKGDKLPQISNIIKIAEEFNCSLDWLCGMAEKEMNKEKFNNYGEVIKFFGMLYDTFEDSFDSKMDYDKKTINEVDLSHGYPEEKNLQRIVYDIRIEDEIVQKFLYEHRRMSALKKEGDVFIENYYRWLDSRIEQFRKIDITGEGKEKYDNSDNWELDYS